MSVEYDDLTFERLGHASIRIETGDDTVVYVDPWNDVLEGEPGDGDVVFVTHDDFDHYDPDAIAAVAGPDTTVAVYEAVDTDDLAFDVVDLPQEGETTVDGIDVETLPAYNDPDGEHVDDAGDPFHAEGDVIGLVLELADTSVFVPSDTDVLSHHESTAADVLVPPIGGHYTMDRHEAADLARSVEPELVLPCHYDTFDPIETDAEAFADDLEADDIRVELF
ncbi:MBL fold metallo-hydrolase [Natrialbaceae archaeon AArc-T1-2]|uniref:MBL fold metallo-hydrolase n=1 Tax=Natrialbaceae archaeon AArc-T1-2 TaxID=3053904 RepID=UPI00255A80D1|nr:MBL fold metallo-hydrolase [Natrialbaceae archaeon AArc-T1-2]WIV68600.1 MBL fold metallo-hydrolase [Natrialbaceae archaeon AArc-T1-2]